MAYLDLLAKNHSKTKRDYLARVNDQDFPKYRAAELAKKWDYDYWDGDRRINYGGYHYKPGYWDAVADALIQNYELKGNDKVLDIGCGKGFLLYELKQKIPSLRISGLDVSAYAVENAKSEIKDNLVLGNASSLPFENKEFDLVFSINTLHNLFNFELESALLEITRVGKGNKYICVESYRNEIEKMNLLYWQVTCESFYTPEEWEWCFKKTGYEGDHSFIFFE